MKSAFCFITIVLLTEIMQLAYSLTCDTHFQQVPYGVGSYCAKCDTTCLTCSGSSINKCSTCPVDFTLNSGTATCTAPISSTINTILSSYHSYGFEKESTWWGGYAQSWSGCGTITVLHGGAGDYIQTVHSLNIHYKIRLLASLWTFAGVDNVAVAVVANLTSASISSNTYSVNSNADYASQQTYYPYCANAFAKNIDISITDPTAKITVSFSSAASSSWGIREYVFIQYLCYQPDCGSCTGPSSTQCLTCADANKVIYTLPTAGPCLCSWTLGYYAYPTNNSTYYCVNPCPNLPTGQYYGDNTTYSCVTSCPAIASNPLWGLSFASDTYGFCVLICPLTITLGGVSVPIFYDIVNKKCTTACPSTQPYSFWVDRACYASCPLSGGKQYYMLNTNMSCVDICPNVTQNGAVVIPLYRDTILLKCVQICPSNGYYGYLNTVNGDRYCTLNCPSPLFSDNSTGRPICTQICPYPNYFGDLQTLPPACVQICSFGTYGDMANSNRQCVAKCNGSYFGIMSGNRTCVPKCPSGSWGERISLVCVVAPFQCLQITITFTSAVVDSNYQFNTFVNSFVDNTTNMCIWANQSCSNGMVKLNSSYTCQQTCPNGTFANLITYWCVSTCYGLYFADSTLNQCVLVCSPGLYADIGSGNKCVSGCNQSAAYPFKDISIRSCVGICTNGYADSIAQACVFNCTAGLYLDNSVPTQLICTTACTGSYFAYNNTDSGICLLTCPDSPPLFGDTVSGLKICVQVCSVGLFGDQTSGGYRHCIANCPNGTFAQNDSSRLCVTRCNSSTYGRTTDWTCVSQQQCPANYVGDPTTNLCTILCPASAGTFADNISKLCVSKCPINGTTIYYADIHLRWCISICQSAYTQFGNNSTQTCEVSCLDLNSYADAQSPYRYCIGLCTNVGLTLYYRDNSSMVCVLSTGCSYQYFGDNSTAHCVQKCPIVTGIQTWGYILTKTCVSLCHASTWGDASTGIPLCVSLCPSLPTSKWSYNGPGDNTIMLCKSVCPSPYYGQDFTRTCIQPCPRPPAVAFQTYAYDGTRRCLAKCPNTTYSDYISGVCFQYPSNCSQICGYTWTNCTTYRWADVYNTSCTYLCTATPWDTYGDNLTYSCTTNCSASSWADNYTGTRICVAVCPGQYNSMGVVNGSYDSYGDNYTQRCVLTCQQPNTFADWQTHLCTTRCTGDNTSWIPTYSNIFTLRCVVALSCPVTPDKYFGENGTRACLPSCVFNSSFADNITRTCIPVCYNYTNGSTFTMFYGDLSTLRPACVIACPKAPVQFGSNSSYLCVSQCLDQQYGDQTGNRTCVKVCPNIGGVTWFSQITKRICVLVCENGTYGNFYNYIGPHCQTVGTDCNITYYGDSSTSMCVPICPLSMNYYGDPSTRLCVTRCPLLNAAVVNATAGINLVAGRLFADYSTRLCVYKCPSNYSNQGTFGDNLTNTCVGQCPIGSFGDANTINRFCVANCTGGSFADNLTMLCVQVCPASPPTFGYKGNYTCVSTCPANLWADSTTRTCESLCGTDFRFTNNTKNTCVSVCPSNPDLYGDTQSYNCTAVCSNNQFADPTDRLCKSNCSQNSLFQYNYRCVKFCPKGYYANAQSNCVVQTSCDTGTYGDNSTTKCVTPCPSGSYSDPASRYCIAVCPSGSYGDNLQCVSGCQTAGTTFSNITQVCASLCPNYTYANSGACQTNCTGSTYQNDQTHSCNTACPNGLYGDPTTHRCVAYCPTTYYRKNTGYCVVQISGCNPQFADFITGNCVTKCSTGYWGYIGNYTCMTACPSGMNLFGYASASERTCYVPLSEPITSPIVFADTVSGQFVSVCPETPTIYFGDSNRHTCVAVCLSYTSVAYYGDPQTRQCQTSCQNATYTADPATSLCTLKCTYNSFRNNNTGFCVSPCPIVQGYGDYTTRICVATCPISANTFGFYNISSGSRLCVVTCPTTYYAESVNRTCVSKCPSTSSYAQNTTSSCVPFCINSFADDSNNICVPQCLSLAYPNADNSTNKCVYQCPNSPDLYADSHVCVYYCTTANYFADTNGRLCVSRCTNLTYVQYGDPRTGRCEVNCSQGTWGDNSTNLCVTQCPVGSFADNTTGKCVSQCPKTQNIYADMILHVCSYTCSNGYFGSQVNQTCIRVCDNNYWGDPTTTLCTALCPVKIYSFGQNDSRTCVTSCFGYSGYADNYSRLCRDICQNTIIPQTYVDPTTLSCVQICPQGYYSYNITNLCLTKCLGGLFADNSSRSCVSKCPSQPQSYGDQTLFVCIYTCLGGQFSDNSTNLCVVQCPGLGTSSVDYYGDKVTGRCVKWCTEGTYAQTSSRQCVGVCSTNEFADNLTRKCVPNCPPSQFTYADPISHACVRICPASSWAQNTTQACVPGCSTYGNGTQTYADNITNYCVAQCPFGYFGSNSSHSCVKTCSLTLDQYGHNIGRVCVAVTNCYVDNSTGIPYYADSTTRTCVDICPLTLWADTHIFKCVPICDAALPQFRNNHTQKCVWPCPSNPDEYADTTTGNCVRTCPSGYYAYTGNHSCVSSCANFSLFADNTTNRCVSVCSTNPYLYADSLLSKCVLHCSGGNYADNTTQTCVPGCPTASSFFGELITYTCVSLCPSGLFADTLNSRTCRSTCSNNYFSDNFTATCVQRCSFILPYYYEDTSLGYGVCVLVCPGESYAYNPNQTCRYQNITSLASTCPSPYYADRLSRQCVKFCPNGSYSFSVTVYCEYKCSGIYYADPILRQCVTTCSPNLFKYQLNATSNLCVQYCPSSLFAQNVTNISDAACVGTCTGLVGVPSTWTCESYCPYPYFANWNSNLCILNCTTTYAYLPNRTCLSTCQSPYYGNPLTKTCDIVCPFGYFGRNDTRMCSTGCPSLSYADPSIRICVSECPSFPLLYADDGTNKCLPSCQSPKFGFMGNRTCLGSCPNISSLIYLADSSNQLCVLECVNALLSFADYLNNVCTQQCPPGYLASNYTKECVLICPNQPNDTFSDNNSRICMDICQPGSFGNHDTLNCVSQCVLPYFADPTTRTCVKFCPSGYYAQNSTAVCRTTCPTNSYADPVTHRCLAQCPALQKYFNYDGNWTCLLTCPPFFYANTDLQSCVSICNSSTGMFTYFPMSLCVRECPIPYRGFPPNMSCVLNCPSQNYFYDVTINQCGQCDSKCIICVSASICTQCSPSYNLNNGNCNQTCIPTNIITYADPYGKCVTFCPQGYYGDNSSYLCTQNCPNKLYGDNDTRLCLDCPATCAICTTFTYCTTCEAGATLSLVDNMCYGDCNATHKYAYNGICWSQCPNTTYLTYTNVLCAVCSAVCSTCSIIGTNCTSCATTYYFNYSCLTTCPSGYYGAPSLKCQSCNSSVNASTACASPLTFTTALTMQNYKYVLILKFNQGVSIKDQLNNILKIRLTARRRMLQPQLQSIQGTQRLLSVSSLINNGISYTYQILDDGTIKLYLSLDTSLVNPTFSVDITDPTAIVSTLTGVSVQNVQSLLSSPSIEIYSTSDGIEAGTNFPAKFSIVAVLLLYVVTFIFSDCMIRPIQILQLLFLHSMINVQVPANLYYFLFQLQPSLFGFVVNWFNGYFPGKAVYSDTPQKIADIFIDYVFLRNVGQMFVLIVILGILWFMFLILSNKRIVSHKIWHKFLEEVSQKRYQLMVINDVMTLFYLPILYFGFLQLSRLFGADIYAFNGFVTLIFITGALVMPIVWLLAWFKLPFETFKERLWFLTLRVTPKINEMQTIHEVHELKTEQKLKDEKGSADSILSEPQPTRNKNYLESIVFSFYLLLMVIWLITFYSSPKTQLILLIVTNIVFLAYTIKARPYLNNINLIFTIITTLTFIGLQAFYLFFLGVQTTMFASEKTVFVYPFIVGACTVVILIILWALWRFVWEVMFYWQNFKKTELYLQFADHDYVGEEEQKSQQYSEYAKIAQHIQAGVGDIFVEKMMQELNQQGQKVIRVTKKVLKRKKRVQEGRKKQVEQMQAISQQQEEDLGYVRVNQMNVFDYDKRFQKAEPEPQSLIKKGTIDDDVREEVSEYYNQQEEEKKVDQSEGRSISYADDFHNEHEELPSQSLGIEESQRRSQEEKMKEEEANKSELQSYPIDDQIAEKKNQPSPRHEEVQMYEQIKSQSIDAPQPKQESNNIDNISMDSAPQQNEVHLYAPPIKNLEDLLQQQQQTKKNKKGLLFLFQDFDE